jgi:hypothetical protein
MFRDCSQARLRALSQITENRKVEAPKSLIFRDPIFESLKLSEFVEGFTWHVYARVGRNETPLFSQDRLDNGEDMRSFSASIDALQTAIN